MSNTAGRFEAGKTCYLSRLTAEAVALACVAGFARGVVVEGGSELTQAREPIPIEPRSELEFITEHYWGYTRQRDGGTLEYYVEHPPWRVWPTREQKLVCDAAELYGEEFAAPIARGPASALLADGSAVRVYKGQRIQDC